LIPLRSLHGAEGAATALLNRSRRSALRSRSRSVSTRQLPKRICPESGTKMSASQCSKVDLPDPLGPITASTSPAVTDTLGGVDHVEGGAHGRPYP